MSGAVQPWGWRYLFRLALGAIFLWAALAKIGDMAGFAAEVHYYRMVPLPLENVFALVLVWVELVAGLALVTNLAPRSGTWVIGGLLVVFFVAILQAVIRGLDIECGCFGTADASQVGLMALARDVAFLVMAWLGYPRRS